MGYLDTIKSAAISAWHSHQILPSLVGSQAALESGWGLSELSKPPYNNHFGIKAGGDWTGTSRSFSTREWGTGGWYWIQAEFRTYPSAEASLRDHAAFFTNNAWRAENYKAVVGEKDYKKAAWALQNAPAPYATDPQYANKLIKIIEEHNLIAWDREAMSGESIRNNTTSEKLTPITKTVGGTITDASREHIRGLNVTVIGDSLGVGTRTPLSSLITNVNFDVLGSRQITHATANLNGTQILTNMKNAGTLRDYVVVILGTNRGVTAAEIDNFVTIAGSSRKILFVDTASEVGHREQVAREYKDASTRHGNVFYVNWWKFAESMMEAWYSPDGEDDAYIHMTPEGYRQHANYIGHALYEAATGDFTKRTGVTMIEDRYSVKEMELTMEGIVTYKVDELQSDGSVVQREVVEDIGITGFHSPYGDEGIYYPEANAQWGTGDDNVWIEGRLDVDNETDLLVIMKKGIEELKERSVPSVQYTVSLLDMDKNISVGDTGIFVDHEFVPPIYIQARILSITTSKTTKSLNTVTIGNVVELFPRDNSEVRAVQAELRNVRQELLNEQRNQGKVTVEVTSSNGIVLGDAYTETHLIAQLKRGVNEVTGDVKKVRWERHSTDPVSDMVYNELLSVETGNTLMVRQEDIVNAQSKFVARFYNTSGALVQQGEVVIKKADTALWTDSETAPTDAKNGSAWVKPDGTQMVKVNNEWEERVDQRVASEIVNRDGVTVSFSDTEPSNGGKAGDVWFKLNEDGTQSIMRNDGEGWFETVTNALNADGIIEGTMDFSLVNAIHINAASITAGHGDFLSIALTALNSKATLDGAALRFTNDDGGFIEMNSVPEIRSTAADSTSVLLDSGRLHFYDKLGMSKGYFGTDIHDGTRDFGIWLSKGTGIFRFARMADAQSTESKYYTVEPGDARVSVITKLVQRGELPDGDGADFVRKSNMIAKLNGWAILPQEWPALKTGQQIKYQEEVITTEGDAYDDIYRIGTSTQGDWRFYHDKYVVFEGGTSLSSDRRIKENIEDTAVIALDHIDDFSFKQFDKIKTGVHTDLGMIAQESGILRVADDEIEGIDLEGSIMLALKGVQELHQVIKEQQEKIDLLEERLNEKG